MPPKNPAIYRYIFVHADPQVFEAGGGTGRRILLKGKNYGQGSSREHAARIAKDGFTKDGIKQWRFEKARVDFSALVPRNLNRIKANRPRWFEDANNHSLPVVDDYRDIMVTVIGGAGKHSLYIPSFGETRSVARAVIHKDGTPVSTVKEFLNTK